MLSRRNIRVKVMQTLYSVETISDRNTSGEPLKILTKKIENSQELLTYLATWLIEIGLYAEKDALKKSQKHLPSVSDLAVDTKIAGNQIIWEILESPSYKNAVHQFKTKYQIDDDVIKRSFFQLTQSETYRDYIAERSRDKKQERKILEYIFETQMIDNEDFINDGEEKFIHWDDDMETAIMQMNAVLHKPSQTDFLEMPSADKMEFARELLSCVMEKNDYCKDVIKPKLKNWEAERIAVLDMILLKMGICELLYFDTIPTKVTLNEYIDIAKEYSTEKSGHFINGILDNIYKDFSAKDLIHKKSLQ